MSREELITSDLTGQKVPASLLAQVQVLKHPEHDRSVVLDAHAAEVEHLKAYSAKLVEVVITWPDREPTSVAIREEDFDALFIENVTDVMAGATEISIKRPRVSRNSENPPAGTEKKTDYASDGHFGQLHRGRVTDAEAAKVRANRTQASRNRQAQGHPAIDWDDPAEQKRYGTD